MKIPNWLYDILKWVSLVALDAFGIAYKELALVWDLPYGDQVKSTCMIISALIGALIGLSSIAYNKQLEKKKAK